MRKLIARYGSLGILFLTYTWLLKDTGWESITAFAVSLSIFIGQDVYLQNTFYKSERDRERDQKLFDNLLSDLPYEGVIRYVSEIDHAEGIRKEVVKRVISFEHYWKSPEKIFINPRLQKEKEDLVRKLQQYIELCVTHTFGDEANRDYQRVPREWRLLKPETYNKVTKQLNEAADNVVASYKHLLEVGRKQL